ncbi:MAG: adenosine deaminase family protein [Myxococcota bacterium]|nr:adenosine deaminase family protein [Myxococcota bacterium]
MKPSRNLLLSLPKTDLHVHLDGSLRLKTLIELAQAQGVELPSYTPEGLEELVFKPTYSSLGDYLQGFSYTCAVLQDAESLERVAYELAWDNINEGVRYIEVRFAPHLHMRPGFGCQEVLDAVNAGLERAQKEYARSSAVVEEGQPEFRYGMIVCALRKFGPQFSPWYAQLFAALSESPLPSIYGAASLELARSAVRARDDRGLPVVAFDLAGEEKGFPAEDHMAAFQFAKEHFLKRTVHAGEAYGPESIFQAITAAHADRIGHGYHLFSADLITSNKVYNKQGYCDALAQYVADRRITIEVCITSNLQTNPEIGEVKNHAFKKMLEHKLSATLCTDNRLMSRTTVTDELDLAVNAFQMDERLVRNTVIYGFKRSFFPGTYLEKRAYVRGIIDYYDKVVREHAAESSVV